MKRPEYPRSIVAVILIAWGSITIPQCGKNESQSLKDATFSALQEIRQAKVTELTAYFELLREKTLAAESDTVLTNLFDLGSPMVARIGIPADHEERIDRHFVYDYGEFYDLLWVDTSGVVFHSVRQESDYQTNLFGDTIVTRLAQTLMQATSPTFVDFEYYSPSAEPGAFQIVPVVDGQILRGWMVFQLSINRVNSILTDHRRMGRTGEVYLVSGSGLMLSQSRFARRSTILSQKVETEPVRIAARAQTGDLLTTDYRDVPVFSSFSRISVFGVVWYVVAEIDEAEVITSHFANNQDAMRSPMLNRLRQKVPSSPIKSPLQAEPVIKVDMSEYGTAQPGQKLKTWGVATCTAVAVTYPGRFAYLAHVPPTDKVYRSNSPELFGGSQETDLLSRLLEQIRRYDVYPYEMDSLRFVVVAVHDEGCWNIIDQLIIAGFFINQMRLLYNPDAQYANVAVSATTGAVHVNWMSSESSEPTNSHSSESIPDLGTLAKELSANQWRGI